MKFLIGLCFMLLVATQAVGQALNASYLRVDLTHPAWPSLLIVLTNKHNEIRPGNVISIAENNDGTEAVVKIIGAVDPFLAGIVNHPSIIEFEVTNESFLELFKTDPTWSNRSEF